MKERLGRGWSSQIAFYLERSQNKLHCVLQMINILATLKLISFCSRIQQIFSAQQYNSILRQIEDIHCFWSTGKTQERRMQFPNWIPKRLIFLSRGCAYMWGVVSVGIAAAKNLAQVNNQLFSIKSLRNKKASNSIVLSSTLLLCDFSMDLACHVLKHQRGFLQPVGLSFVTHPGKVPIC